MLEILLTLNSQSHIHFLLHFCPRLLLCPSLAGGLRAVPSHSPGCLTLASSVQRSQADRTESRKRPPVCPLLRCPLPLPENFLPSDYTNSLLTDTSAVGPPPTRPHTLSTRQQCAETDLIMSFPAVAPLRKKPSHCDGSHCRQKKPKKVQNSLLWHCRPLTLSSIQASSRYFSSYSSHTDYKLRPISCCP